MTALLGLCLLAPRCLAQAPKERAILKGHTKQTPKLAFSADGKSLVSGSWDSTIKLWDVATGKELAAFKGRTRMVWSVAITCDGKVLAAGGMTERSNYGKWPRVKNKPRLTDIRTVFGRSRFRQTAVG